MKNLLNKSLVKHLVLLFGTALAFTACKKNDETIQSGADKQKMAQLIADDIQRSNTLISAFSLGVNGVNKKDEKKVDGRLAGEESCVAFTIYPADLTTFPKTFTYDFGNGCVDDNKNKKGKVILSFGTPWEPNAYVGVEFLNYHENYNKINGGYKLTNHSTAKGLNFTFEANNISLTDSAGKVFSYNIVQNYSQVAGNNTWQGEDDIYEITGTASTILSDGQTLSWSITNPLIKANTCSWAQAGAGIFMLNGKKIDVDYGNGNCDNKATIKIDDYTSEITLH